MNEKLKILLDAVAVSNFKTYEEFQNYIEGLKAGFEFAEQNLVNLQVNQALRDEIHSLRLRLREVQGFDI